MKRFPIKCELNSRLAVDDTRLGFTCNQDEELAIINIQGVIGDYFEGLDAQAMVAQIQEITTPILLRLNTPGGYLHDALDIHNALMSHKQRVTADIVSEAKSAGTVITAAADEVRIAPAGQFMIHRCWSAFLLDGNEEELGEQQKEVDAYRATLRKLDEQIATMLSERSGLAFKEVHDMMLGPDGVDGTTMVGQEVVDKGFADGLIPGKQKPDENRQRMQASARQRALNMLKMRNSCNPEPVA